LAHAGFSNLKRVSVSGNQIEAAGAVALVHAGQAHAVLSDLDLSHNLLTDEDEHTLKVLLQA
jgi:hypothetical protein